MVSNHDILEQNTTIITGESDISLTLSDFKKKNLMENINDAIDKASYEIIRQGCRK